jgi:uncharacterized protein YqkB
MNKTELIEFLNNRFTDEINEIQADLRLISNDLANMVSKRLLLVTKRS